jgi:hypothetical protein
MLDWLIARTPVNSRSSGVTRGPQGLATLLLHRESRDDSYLKCLDTAPHPNPGPEAATAAVLESDSRRLGKLCSWESLNIPLGGLWTVLTAVVVTQMSVGGSLKATTEYFTGTLGGAVYIGYLFLLRMNLRF